MKMNRKKHNIQYFTVPMYAGMRVVRNPHTSFLRQFRSHTSVTAVLREKKKRSYIHDHRWKRALNAGRDLF